jgi:phosphoribosylformimino-5-aminoimidazole carboxamide ribotide isomerase
MFEVIPAIDIRGGKCVRLYQGDYAQETVYGEDPVEMARRWQGEGATRLHVVDLDAARSGEPVNLPIVAGICKALSIPVQMGGGVRSREAVVRTLGAGVQRAIIGTSAAADPDLARALFSEFGESLMLGLDARDGKVAIAGWQEATRWTVVDLALEMKAAGARRIIYTDIATDGTGVGPSLESTSNLANEADIPVIASGGIGSVNDILNTAALRNQGVEGVIVGKALYSGAVDLATALSQLCARTSMEDIVTEILHRADPVGVGFIPDEYDIEAATIVPRLKDAHSEADVLAILHSEFCRWFSHQTAGPKERYSDAASEIWAAWVQRRSRR